MADKISHALLSQFISSSHSNNINLAEYTYSCGATDFVIQNYEFDKSKNKSVWSYTFKHYYFESESYNPDTYFVLTLSNKAFLMYELRTIVTIWVCYTKEVHRKKGYMTELLNRLIEMYPEKNIIIDTFDESLRKKCLKLGIELFLR